jgi:hypothetical protein
MKHTKHGTAKFSPTSQESYRPKYIDFERLEGEYAIGKGKAYPLINDGSIKVIRLVEPGRSRGRVLVEVASVEAYLAKMYAQQNPPMEVA